MLARDWDAACIAQRLYSTDCVGARGASEAIERKRSSGIYWWTRCEHPARIPEECRPGRLDGEGSFDRRQALDTFPHIMPHAYLRFHGDLNDLLMAAQRHNLIAYVLNGDQSVKHAVESLGVPHPEVEAIVANGRGVDFDYLLRPNDRVDVYPLPGAPEGVHAPKLRPPLIPPVRFVLDTHLGRLAAFLRLFGFDTLYRNDYEDSELARIAGEEGRVLLTRDRGLLKRKPVVYGYAVRETKPRRQIVSVLRRYRLVDQVLPWHRCVRCNGLLFPVEKSEILHLLEPKTRLYYDEFRRCANCGQVYWEGSHFAHTQEFIDLILAEAQA
jgi:uncharacterized protein with PIN domain